MTALLAAGAGFAIVLQADGEDLDAVLAQDAKEVRQIRMHESTLDFKLPDPSERAREEVYRGDNWVPREPQRAPMALDADLPMQGRLPTAAVRRERSSRDAKRKNWILPPTPEDLKGEDAETERILFEEDDDLLSSTQRIYERAYRSRNEDETDTDEEANDDESYNFGTPHSQEQAMGLLLPESGLALDPALKPLEGEGFFVGRAADEHAPGLLLGTTDEDDSSDVNDVFAAGVDEEDDSFEAATFELRGVAMTEGPDASSDNAAGFAMTRSVLSGLTGDRGTIRSGASVDFATTADRVEDRGGWRSVLSRTAETMSSFSGTSATDVGAGERFRVSGFGRGDAGRTAPSGVGDFTSGLRKRAPTSFSRDPLGGSLFSDSAGTDVGAFPDVGQGSNLGGGLPDFGTRGRVSGTSSSLLGRGAGSGYGTIGEGRVTDDTGNRGGIRATDQIPNPLGGSLFDR